MRKFVPVSRRPASRRAVPAALVAALFALVLAAPASAGLIQVNAVRLRIWHDLGHVRLHRNAGQQRVTPLRARFFGSDLMILIGDPDRASGALGC